MIFPVLCPLCRSDSGRRTIPSSPEVETFRCGACHHEWSEPARPESFPRADASREFEHTWQRMLQPRG